MDLPATSRLYNEALAAAKFANQRLEARTRVDYTGSFRRFVEFCKQEGYSNLIQKRFVELPGVVAAYINRIATTNPSQWPAEKLRAALSWHYTMPEMLVGGHPHDRWAVETTADGQAVPRGNPARSAAITQILASLINKILAAIPAQKRHLQVYSLSAPSVLYNQFHPKHFWLFNLSWLFALFWIFNQSITLTTVAHVAMPCRISLPAHLIHLIAMLDSICMRPATGDR
ncbi:hypothetical protein F443_00399 [Phytophthora nicotianae P1569]|uniref:Uncharacterized protein n=1 Tax=Phytophthora nicotianae P1569 TaxID=1317065 RepID=V9G1S5_PHYNI|nr:hypothetical protein F443_00399 [Phytophthora nicotianae P1569]